MIRAALMVLLAGLFCGCSKPPCPYGISANSERQKRGIPIIHANWIYRGATGQYEWSNPAHNRDTPKPVHSYKVLWTDRQGNPLSEYDTYDSGKYVKSLDPDHDVLPESITITYNYVEAAKGREPWAATIDRGGAHERLRLDQAEDMLRTWGLDRLDDEPR